jgi:hypothetical protein
MKPKVFRAFLPPDERDSTFKPPPRVLDIIQSTSLSVLMQELKRRGHKVFLAERVKETETTWIITKTPTEIRANNEEGVTQHPDK